MKLSFSAFFILLIVMLFSCGKKDNNPVTPDNSADTTEPFYKRPVILISFTPEWGAPGTEVTLYCRNLNPDKQKNEVYFNNVKADVDSYDSVAKADYIVVIVPQSATTGKIRLVRDSSQDESLKDFIVTDSGFMPPEIYNISSTMGTGGKLEMIKGRNFGSSLTDTRVFIGEAEAEVLSVNDTTIIFAVPCYADPGFISVSVKGVKVNSHITYNVLKFNFAKIEVKNISVHLYYFGAYQISRDTLMDNFFKNGDQPASGYYNDSYLFNNLVLRIDNNNKTISPTLNFSRTLRDYSYPYPPEYETATIELENLPCNQISRNLWVAEAKGSQLQKFIKKISYSVGDNRSPNLVNRVNQFTDSSLIRVTLKLCN